MLRALLGNLLTFICYLLVAFISYLFMPSVVVSMLIWLPSGVALALLLHYRLCVLPAVFLGAAAVNLFIFSHGVGVIERQAYICSIVLSLGALVQGWVGYMLMRRIVAINNSLTTVRDVLLFALLSIFIIASVYPTWSAMIMDIWHRAHIQAIGIDWVSWWVVNGLSLLLLTPCCLIILKMRDALWRSRFIFVAAPLFLTLICVLSIYRLTVQTEYRRATVNLEKAVTQNKLSVERNIQSARFLVRSLKAYFSSSQQVDADEFTTFANFLMRGNDGTFALAWVKLPKSAGSPYQVKFLDLEASYKSRVNQAHFKHLVIQQLTGIQLQDVKPTLSKPYKFFTGDNQAISVMYLNPSYRTAKLKGIAVAAINLTTLFQHAFAASALVSDIQITDITDPNQSIELFKNHDSDSFLMEANPVRITKQFHIDGGQRLWQFTAEASKSFILTHSGIAIWVILFSGLLFSFLITVLLFILHGQKYVVGLKVDAKTRQLRQEMKKNALVLASAGEGIMGLNDTGEITFANKAACKLLGYSEADLLHRDFHQLLQVTDSFSAKRPKKELDVYKTIDDGKVRHIEEEVLLTHDQNFLWVNLTVTSLQSGENLKGVVVVFSDMTQRRADKKKLDRMAHFDTLTGLPNRDSFFRHVDLMIAEAQHNKKQFIVCLADIDNFKTINDSMGHDVGDHLLQYIAKKLYKVSSKKSYIARLGGDEFGFLIELDDSSTDMGQSMEHYLEAFDEPMQLDGYDIKTSLSIGVATYPTAGESAQALLKNADVAMYRAKSMGRNTYAFFDQSIETQVKRYHLIHAALYAAIDQEEFDLVYQPIVSLSSGKIAGVEALIRWSHASIGDVSPVEFIPIAEESGLIHLIGDWVIREAAHHAALLSSLVPDLFMSINISVKQFGKANFVKTVQRELQYSNVDTSNILFEVTETALIQDPEGCIDVMKQLHKLGIGFALDDFGTGYSSMDYLRHLPISYIKIDKTFVDEIFSKQQDAAIIQATISLAKALDLKIIAEGVEDAVQQDWLKEAGCEYMQGYLFSKPMSYQALSKWIKNNSAT